MDYLTGFYGLMTSKSVVLEEDDLFYILGRLSFAYHYSEWNEAQQQSIPYRLNYLIYWRKIVSHTDTLTETWVSLLTAKDRPSDFLYFGNRQDLWTLCRIAA